MQKSAMEGLKELSRDLRRMKIAVWLLLAYSAFLTFVVWGVQNGLWTAVDANYEVLELRTKEAKLPCSSEINENCAIYVK